ncbi:hypothetical protein FD755_017722 [Muntiacus reevesi]|uniref:Uncharacterized protein n=1 Tax=Muntiacus reevesi TaxID=9886 RepID=A0A5N3XBG7_MUNRE|nr:hypothetical protein FD755_017722 [Muntiacus reevesi]
MHWRWPQRANRRKETSAVQIILTLFHYALGALSASLFFEEDIKNTGDIPILLPLGYIVWSSPFFLISGSMAISAQKKPTRYKLTSTIVMSIFSGCFSAFGSIILCFACFSYAAEMKEYVWSQLAGGMLLQYLLFSSVTELIVVSIIVSWIVQALHHPASKEETLTAGDSEVQS